MQSKLISPSTLALLRSRGSFIAWMVFLVAMLQGCGAAEEVPAGSGTGPGATVIASIVRGGLLYDHWMDATATPAPDGLNPLWAYGAGDPTGPGGPTAPKPEKSWRCKQCHGWDYKGKEGAYDDKSSNFTGFGGILDAKNLTAAEVEDKLNNGFSLIKDPVTAEEEVVHNFGGLLSAENIKDLTAFIVSGGVLDTDNYITVLPKGQPIVSGGHATRGKDLYTVQRKSTAPNGDCSQCHGDNGVSAVTPALKLGELSREDPWEVLHKIRFGQAGDESPSMPSLLESGLTDQDAADILAHAMTLTDK